MAAYTMQLREIIEHYSQYDPNMRQKERLKKGIEEMFKEIDYPIFSEEYRETFQENFARHFYFREIGFETEYQFLFRLESWLKLHMPYFNKLFETESIKYDPLTNINVVVDQDVSRENNTDNTVTSTGEKTGHVDTTGNSVTDANDSTTNEQETNTKSDSTTDGTSTSDGTSSNENVSHSETDGTSSNKNVSHSTTDGNSSNKNVSSGDSTETAFDKKLYEDTPDGRLSITDGLNSSSIEYATNITEDKGTKSTHNDSTSTDTGTTNSTTDGTSTDTGTTNATTDGTSTDKSTSHDKTVTSGTSSETGNMKTDGTTSGQQHSETNTKGTQDSRENSVDKIVGNVFGTGNETLRNTRTGKDGTQTYQSMILELRETFMRIERDIFKEMNKELFMLIY